MNKFLISGLLAASMVASASGFAMAKGHTEAISMACMERTSLSEEVCACMGNEAKPFSPSQTALLLSVRDGEANTVSTIRENDVSLIDMARVHWYLRVAPVVCSIAN